MRERTIHSGTPLPERKQTADSSTLPGRAVGLFAAMSSAITKGSFSGATDGSQGGGYRRAMIRKSRLLRAAVGLLPTYKRNIRARFRNHDFHTARSRASACHIMRASYYPPIPLNPVGNVFIFGRLKILAMTRTNASDAPMVETIEAIRFSRRDR